MFPNSQAASRFQKLKMTATDWKSGREMKSYHYFERKTLNKSNEKIFRFLFTGEGNKSGGIDKNFQFSSVNWADILVYTRLRWYLSNTGK